MMELFGGLLDPIILKVGFVFRTKQKTLEILPEIFTER